MVRQIDDIAATGEAYTFDKAVLWHNTVYPATDADNWFVSGSAAYWGMLNGLPADRRAGMAMLREQLADMNARLLYTVSREGNLAPVKAKRDYTEYKDYLIPRIRGTFLLHQIRLLYGNQAFSRLMNTVHDRFRNSPMSTAQFISLAEKEGVKGSIIRQWLEREDIPNPVPSAEAVHGTDGWSVRLSVNQPGQAYAFAATVAIETSKNTLWRIVRVDSGKQTITIPCGDEPSRIIFNAGNDIPVARKNYYILPNFFDDYQQTLIVFGTSCQVEANHTLALRYQTLLADRFTESLPPVWKDCEIDRDQLASHDFILLGGAADNSLTRQFADTIGLKFSGNTFVWKGRTYGEPDDGAILVYPNPYNPAKVVYIVLSNSALQLYQMTKNYQPIPSWAIYKADQVVEKGYHANEGFELELAGKGDLQSRK